jgi:hypothetical protein
VEQEQRGDEEEGGNREKAIFIRPWVIQEVFNCIHWTSALQLQLQYNHYATRAN